LLCPVPGTGTGPAKAETGISDRIKHERINNFFIMIPLRFVRLLASYIFLLSEKLAFVNKLRIKNNNKLQIAVNVRRDFMARWGRIAGEYVSFDNALKSM
jgi:hypothetical protein